MLRYILILTNHSVSGMYLLPSFHLLLLICFHFFTFKSPFHPISPPLPHTLTISIPLSLYCFSALTFLAFGHNECPDPGIPLNARRFGDNFHLGSSISVVCEEGFIKTQGTDILVCQLEGGKVMWSGPIPKCEGTLIYINLVLSAAASWS